LSTNNIDEMWAQNKEQLIDSRRYTKDTIFWLIGSGNISFFPWKYPDSQQIITMHYYFMLPRHSVLGIRGRKLCRCRWNEVHVINVYWYGCSKASIHRNLCISVTYMYRLRGFISLTIIKKHVFLIYILCISNDNILVFVWV